MNGHWLFRNPPSDDLSTEGEGREGVAFDIKIDGSEGKRTADANTRANGLRLNVTHTHALSCQVSSWIAALQIVPNARFVAVLRMEIACETRLEPDHVLNTDCWSTCFPFAAKWSVSATLISFVTHRHIVRLSFLGIVFLRVAVVVPFFCFQTCSGVSPILLVLLL